MRPRRTALLVLLVAVASGGCETMSGIAQNVNIGLPGGAGRAVEGARVVAAAAPKIGEAFAEIEEGQEIEIGRAVTANVGKRYPVLRNNPALTRYVSLVGNAVAMHSDRPDMRYYFAVLDTDEVNAFATPGGFVFVTRGALRHVGDEAGLAGVLGHEVAHIALYHGVKAIKAGKQKDLAVFAVREGAAQSGRAAAFRGAIGSTADFFSEQVILKGYSREQEAEADRLGQQYAARAGYDPGGLRDFLSSLVERGGREATATTFFSTHPGTRERRDELQQLLATAPAGGRRNPERLDTALRGGSAATTGATTTGPAEALVPPSPGPTPSEIARLLQGPGRYTSQAIVFDPGSERFRGDPSAELRQIADALTAAPAMRLRIEGHTDAAGNPEQNRRLSERRAEAVKSALVTRFAVKPERLVVVGLGSAHPLVPNDTPDNRARNRRVEFIRE